MKARLKYPEHIEKIIREELEYRDGHLYWKTKGKRGRRRLDVPAGTLKNGRSRAFQITKEGKNYAFLEHRVIFWLHHGYWPTEVDHVDRNPLNNRIENLREVTSTQNKLNVGPRKTSTTGEKNVYWFKPHKMWKVQMQIGGKCRTFGYFHDFELAVLVAREAREKYHGEFAYNE